jgi:hypothetical protein
MPAALALKTGFANTNTQHKTADRNKQTIFFNRILKPPFMQKKKAEAESNLPQTSIKRGSQQ